MAAIVENLKLLETNVKSACRRVNRDPSGVRLIAVTKTQPAERVREAAAAGLKLFAESRIQEAKLKLSSLPEIGEWHFIGHLQSNKIKQACELFDLIQSVDSLGLAENLASFAVKGGHKVSFLAE